MQGSAQSRSFRAFLFFPAFIFALPAWQAAATQDTVCEWNRGDLHNMHWPQTADFSANGTDISLSQAVLADDFRCSATGPIQGIHIWGSFLDDALPNGGPASLTLELSIYSDVAGDDKTLSRPGKLFWSQIFSPGDYTVRVMHNGAGHWYDPATDDNCGNYRRTFQYNFCADEPFVQQEGAVYWLGIRQHDAATGSRFGWKTTGPHRHWNGRAVYLPQNTTDWLPLDYPSEHPYAGQAVDLAFVITSGDSIVAQYDLGDAPDSSNSLQSTMTAYPSGVPGNFPTVYQAGSPPYGPLHLMPWDAFFLGRWVSGENEADLGPDEDSINNLSPLSDRANADGGDDGLHWPVIMPSGELATLDYTITVTSPLTKPIYVNVWCDWNRDGDWNDVIEGPDGTMIPEWAVQDHQLDITEPGTFRLTTPAFYCWHPETDGDPDPLWVRITVSERPWSGDPEAGGSGPEGGYDYGETEDYYLQPEIEPVAATYDWGDAPDSIEVPGYPTLAVHDGARHIIGGPWLGDATDRPEANEDGQPHPRALGDTNENGVCIPPLIRGQLASITLQVSGGGGVVQGWIDFDGDSSWQDNEQVVNTFLPDGIHSVSFVVPENAVLGQTFARFRISTSGGLEPTGAAWDGEVEDHEVWIRPVPFDAKWYQGPDLTPDGMDIRVDGNNVLPRILADDFLCTSQDRLTQVRLWGSWKDDRQGRIKSIRVSIHPDNPADPPSPGRKNFFAEPYPAILWEKTFLESEFQKTLYYQARIAGQRWWDAASDGLTDVRSTKVWQIDLDIEPSEAFLQSGSPAQPEVYWLAVAVETTEGQFGWKTRQGAEHSLGAAVSNFDNVFSPSWQELRYPQGHPSYDIETNSIDLAFCLMYTPDYPDHPTSRPGAVTQCPAVVTKCPITITQCPTMTTLCPAVTTKCPATVTKCPPFQTQCPPSQTVCPVSLTTCPTTETRCPATATQCPTMTTYCPAVATKCPTVVTTCPSVQTQCPVTATQCPPYVTECPTTQTQCPVVSTTCPPFHTQCPVVSTECPSGTIAMTTTYDQSCPIVEVASATVADYLAMLAVQ